MRNRKAERAAEDGVTANQSARPPTIPASATARISPPTMSPGTARRPPPARRRRAALRGPVVADDARLSARGQQEVEDRSVAGGPSGYVWVPRGSPPLHAWPSAHEPRFQSRAATAVAVQRAHGTVDGVGDGTRGSEGARSIVSSAERLATFTTASAPPATPTRAATARTPAAARHWSAETPGSPAAPRMHIIAGASAAAIGTARRHADTRDDLRRRTGVDGHEGARGEADHDEPPVRIPRWSCTRLAIARMAAASTAAASLVGHAEPVPAPIGIVAPALRGIQHDETTGLSGDVEARAEREVLRRLPAPMKRDHEGRVDRRRRGDIERVRPPVVATVRNVPAAAAGVAVVTARTSARSRAITRADDAAGAGARP